MLRRIHRLEVRVSFNKELSEKDAKALLQDAMRAGINQGILHRPGSWARSDKVNICKVQVKQSVGRTIRHLLSGMIKQLRSKDKYVQGSYGAAADIIASYYKKVE